MSKALISGKRVILFGEKIEENGNNQRVTKSNGEITGTSVSDYIIVDTKIPDTENPKDYKYADGEIVKIDE